MLFAAPATSHAASPDDPLEPFNRSMYVVHRTLDHWVFGPAAHAYATVLPPPVRKGLRNLINNLKEPGIAFNDLLQAHPTRAAKTTGRFIINSTVGLGGLMDIAYNAGIPHHDNGFGTTAARYGMTPGPYLFIPFIGPTNFRDILGQAADIATDPLGYQPFRNGQVIYARAIVDGLDQRAAADTELRTIDDMSADPYASLRSLYEQNRAVQVQEAITGVPGSATPTFDDLQDPGAAPAPAPAPAAPAVDPG
ncbi:MAG TPA: VacJ family lipoprotein [Caulobacteraceae bacterium]